MSATVDGHRRACRRSRDGWRAQLGCGITLFIHRNGWNSATPLDLQNNTRDELLAEARAHWADVTDFYGADGRLKPSTWQPLVDGEHIYAARPYEMWMWAGRAEGVRETIDVDGREVVLETLDLSPRLFRLHGLLTPNEIAEIRRAADAQGWAPSVSFDPDTGREYSLAEGRRRAHTAWVGTEYGFKRPDLVTNEALERLQRRAADAARVHVGHAEPWQVVKYDVGDGQLHHIDGLKTAHGSTRSVTVLVYLTTVAEGGATNFPFAAGGNGDIDEPGSCARGRNIQPKAGDAVLFYNIEPPSLNGHDSSNGGGGGGGSSSGGGGGAGSSSSSLASSIDAVGPPLDPRARHAACRLELGEKLIANIWVHDTPVNESLAVSASCDKFASSLGERVPAAGGAGAMAGASVARGPRWLWCEEEMRRELGLFEVRGALHRRR